MSDELAALVRTTYEALILARDACNRLNGVTEEGGYVEHEAHMAYRDCQHLASNLLDAAVRDGAIRQQLDLPAI